MTRPAETLSAIVTALVGLITIIQQVATDGFQVDDVQIVMGAVTVLAAAVAPVVTWYVARRQRNPQEAVGSAPDGTVTGL